MKKKFFIAKLRSFLLLIFVPIIVFGMILFRFIFIKVNEDVKTNSSIATNLMYQSMDYLVRDLDYYRVSVDYDAGLHVAIISSLMNDEMTYEKSVNLRQAMQYLNFSSTAKPYLHSIYITMKDSPYMIHDGSRVKADSFIDQTWISGMNRCKDGFYVESRAIKKSKIDHNETAVVSVYQNMKYHEVLIINITKSFFDQLLDSITDYDRQLLLVLNQDNQIIFSNHFASDMSPELLSSVTNAVTSGNFNDTNLNGYYYNAVDVQRFGLKYVSLVPVKIAMKLPNLLVRCIIIAMAVSFVISFLLAYWFTQRDYRQIYQIIEVFEKAEKGDIKEAPFSEKENAYFRIINNIISLFISKTYLNVQLEAKKYALMTAQLSALQYQLNPHFLFNTLQAIDLEMMKTTGKPSSANEMIGHLSTLLRYSLEDPTEFVTVDREIAMTKHYSEIQKQKLGNLFVVTWEIADNCLKNKILKLILQPIIENSIVHFEAQPGKRLWIKVKIFVRNSNLVICILDNGNGMDKEKLRNLREAIRSNEVEKNGRHIGLKNIAQRVSLGMNGELTIKSKPGMGTIVEIKSKI